jgi:hypothetical protein
MVAFSLSEIARIMECECGAQDLAQMFNASRRMRADDELSPTMNTIPQALDLKTLKRKPCYTAEQTVTDEDLSSSSFKEHSLGRANQAAFFSSQGS